MRKFLICTIVTWAVWLFGSGNAFAKPLVVASIQPLGLIAEEILSPVVPDAVTVLVPQNASPHGFSLKPSDLKDILQAPVLLWLGPSLEPYLEKAIAKRAGAKQATVITAEMLDDLTLLASRHARSSSIQAEDHHNHQNHHGHDHGNSRFDPHLWWSAGNAVVIARKLTASLSEHYPQHAAALAVSLKKFERRLTEASANFKPATKQIPFLIYHDAFVYLEDELKLYSKRRITVSPEIKPSLKDLLSLSRFIDKHQVACIIVEPGANTKLLKKLNPNGAIKEVSIDPLGWDASRYTDMWVRGANIFIDCATRH